MTPNPELRIGDVEREAAAASLREHYAQGRLTLDELNDRLDASFTAKTQSQLEKITADLPHAQAPWGQAQQAVAPAPAQRVRCKRSGIGTVAAFVSGFVVLAFVLLALHDGRSGHSGGILLLVPALIVLRIALFRAFGRRRGWYQNNGQQHHHQHHHHHHDGSGGQSSQWSDQRWSNGPGRGSDDTW